LRPDRLTVEQCAEMLALVEARADGTLSDRKRRRLEKLVGIAADDRDLYARARAEREADERQAAEAERARLEAMPVRRFEGRCGAYLPGYLYGWLTSTDEGSLNVTDIAVLAVIVMAIENQHSPFVRPEFVDGAIVIDNATGFAFPHHMNPDGVIGERSVRDAIVYLAGNDWLEIGTLGGRTSVTLGARARKLLEGATEPLP
jgi:hypothetical protein